MRKKNVAVLSGLALAVGITLPSSAVAETPDPTMNQQHCQEEFHAAVVEDNEAYNAKDAARYEAILNPRLIYAYDGTVIYGRDAIMENARRDFAVPGWVWTYTIQSETVYGCASGIAVLDAHAIKPGTDYDHHFAVTMTMVRESGRWTVAMDTVHRLSP